MSLKSPWSPPPPPGFPGLTFFEPSWYQLDTQTGYARDLALSCFSSLPEQHCSWGLWGQPGWLLFLLSLSLLVPSCLPVFCSCSLYMQYFSSLFVAPTPGQCSAWPPLQGCLGSMPRFQPCPLCSCGCEGGWPSPAPPFPNPGCLPANCFSTCLFQVQLYVWHVLPLGKDLLHWIPAILQAGVCPSTCPGPGLQAGAQEPAGCPWSSNSRGGCWAQRTPL